jgi:hypothetical protein
MTRSDTIIFFEGRENDPTFYEAIARRYHRETGREIDLREATELPNAALPSFGGSGGKRALLRASRFVRRWRGCLTPNVLGSKEIAFCLDKDVDEIQGRLERRPALIYTRFHSVENHLVRSADLHQAVAHALSVTTEEARSQLPACERILDLAKNWAEWVEFSILAVCLQCQGQRGYGQSSKINSPAHLPADRSLTAMHFASLRASAHCGAAEFDLELQRVSELVHELIRNGRFDEIFKGKWYDDILFSLCGSCQNWHTRCQRAGKNTFWVSIRGSFILNEDDYQYYKAGLQRSGP